MLAPIHASVFILSKFCPFKILASTKAIFVRSGRDTWVTTHSWGQGEMKVEVQSGGHTMTCPRNCGLTPFQHKWTLGWELVMTSTRTPGLVLISPPSREASKITLAISLYTEWLRPGCCCIHNCCCCLPCTTCKHKNNLPPAQSAGKWAGSNCSLHAMLATPLRCLANFYQRGGGGGSDCHCERS